MGLFLGYTHYAQHSITVTDTHTCLPRWFSTVSNIRYPHSILFGILEADMIGCRDRDVNAARELLESLTPHVGPELKGEAAAIGCMVKGFNNAIQCSSV